MTALVDIVHAFAIADPSKVGLAVKQYVKMLLCEVCMMKMCAQFVIQVLSYFLFHLLWTA